MATQAPRRRPKNPEGRMPLGEHLRELRTRLLRSGLAVAAGAVAGWYLYPSLFHLLQQPILDIKASGKEATLSFPDVAGPFNTQLKLSAYTGIVLASPVWLYQLWAFAVPGLTKREKRYALGFVAVAVPLFLAGLYIAWLVLPTAMHFLTAEFTPEGAANIINAEDYFTFVSQMFLAFGIAFVIPLLLVALNMVGVLPAIVLARGWRVAVFLTFLFAAIASPSPDAGSMLALAFPMTGLYVLALGICALNDRRRRRREAARGFGGDDDSASAIEGATPLEDDAG